MATRSKQILRRAPYDGRADGQARPQAFGHGDHIGQNSRGLESEKVTGTPDASLNLINNQEEPVFIA